MSLNFCENLTDKKTSPVNKVKLDFKDKNSSKKARKEKKEIVEKERRESKEKKQR